MRRKYGTTGSCRVISGLGFADRLQKYVIAIERARKYHSQATRYEHLVTHSVRESDVGQCALQRNVLALQLHIAYLFYI